ncbi:histidine kinase [Desulfosporosinus acidiphilus SJ4]|uniref:histidine kinase n=1 Tax=Desulfosporosinus acidiphilus (strain DSM 22704 / JCM 16185 / SJ4) TaxID=646529 RepID=I4D7V3_DESAJ|nr:sensor histidine kinase [Desulfosporosinus acidiphilus]AFM41877.1 histidine kinase [Desulfosporosinus acidiphilus SJ4]
MSDKLGDIIKNTLEAIESGKEEIFFIAETTRNETLRLTNELSQLKSDISDTICLVDAQEKVDRQKRMRLMAVNSSYQQYTQKEMIEAYAEAKDAQVSLQLLQSREAELRKRRNELERSLNQMQETIDRAQNLMTQVSMAISLLQGEIEGALNSHSHEQRQELGLRIIKAQEEERRRVAREIHDGPAQTLANIVLRLEIAEKLMEYNPSHVKAELIDLKNLVRANLQDIRRIIFDLRPLALNDQGLSAAISKYLDNFSNTYGITCEFKVAGHEKRLLPGMEAALFRLIQEGITNVAKHAHSAKVNILLNFQDDWTSVRIQDYGIGFEVDSAMQTPGEHFGLIGMRERVEMFYGRLSIQSSFGKGTIIKFLIPSRGERGDKL